jgi:hypothetical protein
VSAMVSHTCFSAGPLPPADGHAPAPGHGFHGIEDQVHQALLHQGVIAPGGKRRVGQIQSVSTWAMLSWCAVSIRMVSTISIRSISLGSMLFCRAKLSRFLTISPQRMASLTDKLEVAVESGQSFRRQRLVPDVGQDQLIEGNDAGNGVVDLVAYRCHQPTQGGQTVLLDHPGQVFLDGLGAAFDPCAQFLADVPDYLHHLHDFTQLVEQRIAGHMAGAGFVAVHGDFVHRTGRPPGLEGLLNRADPVAAVAGAQ